MSVLKKWVNYKTGKKISLIWTDKGVLLFEIEEKNGTKATIAPTYDQITGLLTGLELEEKMHPERIANIRPEWRVIITSYNNDNDSLFCISQKRKGISST